VLIQQKERVMNKMIAGAARRNRTFNLLIAEQSAKCLLFQRLLDFHSGQKWAVLGVVVMKDVMSFEA
jgi:hypothetical protein